MAQPLFTLTKGALRVLPFLSRLAAQKKEITATEALRRVRAAGLSVRTDVGREIFSRLREARDAAETGRQLGLNLIPRLASIPIAPGRQFERFRHTVEVRGVNRITGRRQTTTISVVSEDRLTLQQVLDDAQMIIDTDPDAYPLDIQSTAIVSITRRAS